MELVLSLDRVSCIVCLYERDKAVNLVMVISHLYNRNILLKSVFDFEKKTIYKDV